MIQRKLEIIYEREEPALSDDVCYTVDRAIAQLPKQQKRAIILKHLTYAPNKDKAKTIRVGVRRFHDLVSAGYRRVYYEIIVAT